MKTRPGHGLKRDRAGPTAEDVLALREARCAPSGLGRSDKAADKPAHGIRAALIGPAQGLRTDHGDIDLAP